jgi:1-acyl-sn-glycerol-3-phosphate acyltransferase
MDHDVEAPGTAIISKVGVFRRFWGVIATLLSVFYTVILSAFAALVCVFVHGHWVTPLMQLWSWLIFRTCGISAEIEGLENLEGLGQFVLVSNHQSLFDIVAITHLIPGETRFVAKRELVKLPLIGFVMAHSGNIVIDRQSGGRAIRRGLQAVHHGYRICVFAEGHRFSDNRVHEFSDGAAWLAIATRLPCVPLAISGTAALMPRGAKFVIPGSRMLISVGKPIDTTGLRSADREELTRRLEAKVLASFRSEV